MSKENLFEQDFYWEYANTRKLDVILLGPTSTLGGSNNFEHILVFTAMLGSNLWQYQDFASVEFQKDQGSKGKFSADGGFNDEFLSLVSGNVVVVLM